MSAYGTHNASDVQTITAASSTFAVMTQGEVYRFCSSSACWIRFSAAGTAAVAGAVNNHYVPANWPVDISAQGTFLTLTAIRDTADGKASLTLAIPGL